MKFVLLFIGVLFTNSLLLALEVPPDLAQSSPSLQWHSIENDHVRLIYPDYLQGESVYIANLIEHYSKFVGQTYGITNPRPFNLVIRSEMAEPNGFVALAPRRSEWFTSAMFSPAIGSAEWYQALSIHEYRHVNQFDYFNQDGARALYYVMGEAGLSLAAGLSLHSWYFEGDAVWTETKYTDGGRGRSPRFMARLKALVLSDEIPTYDEFLNGTYRTSLPNQYAYGYALISYATQKYGDDIWKRVIDKVSLLPIPLRLYVAFHDVTGQRFSDFYNEAMNDLRTKWSGDKLTPEPRVDYRENSSPFKTDGSLYYVKRTLDSYPTLYREVDGQVEKVAELPYSMDFMPLDIGRDKAISTEFFPDKRYDYKGSSDLILLDLKSGKKLRLTDGERLYNPRLNQAGTKIIATDFRPDQTWNVSEFDLNGNLLLTLNLAGNKVAEAAYQDDNHAVVLLENKIGERSIVVVDLLAHKIEQEILPSSRNILHSLSVDTAKNIFFEAQYKGYNDIFRFDGNAFSRCTNTKIAAYTPFSDGENLFYSHQDLYGSLLAKVPLSACKPIPTSELVNFNYLGDTPSDNYNAFKPQSFPEQAELFTKDAEKYKPEPYGDFDAQLLMPHTWGLRLGRGGGIGATTDNYLHTLSLSAASGTSAEERQSYTEFNFDIKKYYPIIRLQAEYRKRKVVSFNDLDSLQWSEKSAGVGLLLPYIKKSGFYNFQAVATATASYADTSEYKLNEVQTNSGAYYYKMSTGVGLLWSKDSKPRSIISPWLLGYDLRYDQAAQPSSPEAKSARVLHAAELHVPSIFDNDGFRFTYTEQRQNENLAAYQFLPEGSVISYIFSRGYDYRQVPYFQKLSVEHIFPLAYPDFSLGGFYYLRRIYAKAFFDSTYVKYLSSTATLNSYGAEVYFESKILRVLPLSFGARVVQRMVDNKVRVEAFGASGVSF